MTADERAAAQAKLEAAIAGGFWIVLTDLGQPWGIAGADPHMTWDGAMTDYQEAMARNGNAVVLKTWTTKDGKGEYYNSTQDARRMVSARYRATKQTPPDWLED